MDLNHLRRVVADAGEDRPQTAAPGSLIGKYRIEKELARGGMGIVYRATDPDLRRAVAVKVLQEGLVEPRNVVRLHQEARAAASLRHPNIVTVHEVGMAGERPYIVMDFVEGPTFRQAQAMNLPRRQALEILELVARAVQHAHEQGIIHRDLKPDNVLLDASGRPFVTDFGLARIEGTTRITSSGSLLGTPVYMAPEQVKGKQGAVGRRSDVYALGVMLFEILTGRAPFVGETAEEILIKVVTEDPPRPSSLKAGIDRDVETITLKAMAAEPERRYATAGAFADDLRRYLRGEPVVARPVSALGRVTRKLRRHRVVASLAGAIVVAVAIGVYFAWAARAAHRRLAETVRDVEALAEQSVERYENALLGPARPLDAERAELERVAETLRRRYAESPEAHEVLIVLGKVHAKLGRFEEAEQTMTDGLQRLGARAAARHYLERAFVRVTRMLHAIYRREAAADPAWRERRDELAQAAHRDLDEASKRGLDPAKGAYIGAVTAMIRHDGPACRSSCQELLADRRLAAPFQADVLHLMGGSWLQEGREHEAIAVIDQAAQIKRSDPLILLDAALVRYSASADALAAGIDLAIRARTVDPACAPAWMAAGILWGNLAQARADGGADPQPAFEEALAALGRAERLDPRNPLIFGHRAAVHYQRAHWRSERNEPARHDLEAALADARSALALRSNERAACIVYAGARIGLAESEGMDALALTDFAVNSWNIVLRSFPDDHQVLLSRAQACGRRAVVLQRMGRDPEESWEKALADLDRVIALRPRTVNAHMYRALILAMRSARRAGQGRSGSEDHEAAEAAFAEALRLDASRGSSWLDRGQHRLEWYEATHDADWLRRATEDVEQAVALAPQLGQAHAVRAEALGLAGRWRDAVTAFERAFELDASLRGPYGANYELCRRRLGQ